MISVIVPIYNEEKNIVKFQKQFEDVYGNYEIIFSDGGSSDSTLSLIDKKYIVVNSLKGRAKQMNSAVKYAKGDVLLFLHSDSIIEPNLFSVIYKSINEGVQFGCQRLSFNSDKTLLRVCQFMSNLRVTIRKIAFGDQGIFISRKLYDEIGGIPDLPIMEDYELSLMLKKKGIKVKAIDSTIITSPRRFEKNGVLKTVFLMQKLQFLYRNGVSSEKIYNMYYDVR